MYARAETRDYLRYLKKGTKMETYAIQCMEMCYKTIAIEAVVLRQE